MILTKRTDDIDNVLIQIQDVLDCDLTLILNELDQDKLKLY